MNQKAVMMLPGNYPLRCALFLLGLMLITMGTALTIQSSLGTPPFAALPYVASLGLRPTVGFFSVALNLLFVAIQAGILRKKVTCTLFMQIPVGFLFGFMLDLWMAVIPSFGGAAYVQQLLFLFAGTLITAVGIFIEVHANILMTAGEGLVLVLAITMNKKFGSLKIYADVTLVLLAVLLSLALLHNISGVREGTVISAVFTGVFIKLFHTIMPKRI